MTPPGWNEDLRNEGTNYVSSPESEGLLAEGLGPDEIDAILQEPGMVTDPDLGLPGEAEPMPVDGEYLVDDDEEEDGLVDTHPDKDDTQEFDGPLPAGGGV